MPEYRVELARLAEDEIARTARLLRLVSPGARHLTVDSFAWMYGRNPAGSAVACNVAPRPSRLNLARRGLAQRGYLPDPARFIMRAIDTDPF